MRRLLAPVEMLEEFRTSGERDFKWEGRDLTFRVSLMADSEFLDLYGSYSAVWLTEERRCVVRDRGGLTTRAATLAHEYVHFLQEAHPFPTFGLPPRRIRSGSPRVYHDRDHEFYAYLVQDLARQKQVMSDLPPEDRMSAFKYHVGVFTTSDIFDEMRRLHGAGAFEHMKRVRRLEPSVFIRTLKASSPSKWRHVVKCLSKHME